MTKCDVTDLSDAFVTESGCPLADGSSAMADFDEAAYRPFLDGLDLTDAQASELMRIVWNIMRMWVEMDLPVDSCGQMVECLLAASTTESNPLK